MSNKIIAVVGPTAVGKTYVSVELAKKLNSEVISADSMQIYKGMDVGTAKITEEEKQGIKHHMIDIVAPDEDYSVSEFKNDAEYITNQMLSQGKIPVIAGGSGLYVNSLVYNLDFSNAQSDERIRKYYTDYYKKHGGDALYDKLIKVDRESADKIHKNNVKRVIRALEVYDLTGRKFSEINTDIRKRSNKYDCILVGLSMERKLLYERINQRVDEMLSKGLVEEVKALIEKGYDKTMTSMKGIGYKEIIDYLEGNTDYETAVITLKQNTRKFAKRQYTWFLRDENVKWFSMDDLNEIDKTLNNIFEYIEKSLKEGDGSH